MLTDYFPVYGLRVTTGDLELRLPQPEELSALADLAYEGIHDPAERPFLFPWTDAPPAERARGVVQHHWRKLGEWTPQSWTLPLTVFADGEVVGLQAMSGENFGVTREAHTGSWLGMRFHGRGIGTRMRAAILHLAFTGLGATEVTSGYLDGNDSSRRVSEKVGYRPDGTSRHSVRDELVTEHRLRLTRNEFEARNDTEFQLSGLDECRFLFGV